MTQCLKPTADIPCFAITCLPDDPPQNSANDFDLCRSFNLWSCNTNSCNHFCIAGRDSHSYTAQNQPYTPFGSTWLCLQARTTSLPILGSVLETTEHAPFESLKHLVGYMRWEIHGHIHTHTCTRTRTHSPTKAYIYTIWLVHVRITWRAAW